MVRFSPKKGKRKLFVCQKNRRSLSAGCSKKFIWREMEVSRKLEHKVPSVRSNMSLFSNFWYLTSASTLLYLVQRLEIVTGKVWISHFQKCVSDIKVKFCPTKHVLGKFIFQIWNNVRDLLVKVKKDKYRRHPIFKFS